MNKTVFSSFTILCLLSTVFLMVFRVSVEARPDVIYVPDDYQKIQSAINNASIGDTIFVRAGTYYENIIVNKSVSLIGENRSTIIDGSGWGTVVEIRQSVTITGFTIQGSGYGDFGVSIEDSRLHLAYCHITNNHIANNSNGILIHASNNIISGNTIANNRQGLWILQSSYNNISQNEMSNNEYNLGVKGYELSEYVNSIDTSNLVNGRPVYYLVNRNNLAIDPTTYPEIGYLALINSTDILIENLNLTNNGQGLLLANTNNSIITSNNLTNNYNGIYLCHSCHNNTILGNSIVKSEESSITLDIGCNHTTVLENKIVNNYTGHGISCALSSHNTICSNDISKSEHGIFLDASSNNTISQNKMAKNKGAAIYLCRYHRYAPSTTYNIIYENNITANDEGIRISFSSDRNFIFDNKIAENNHGIHFWDHNRYNEVFSNNIEYNNLGVWLSPGDTLNQFYHNNFIENKNQIGARGSLPTFNIWNNDYPFGGNYWSDYNGTDSHYGMYQNETGFDLIGDFPYGLDENNQDNYPLMDPFVPEMEEIRIAYRSLLLKYAEICSDLDALNSTCIGIQESNENLQEQIDFLNSTFQTTIDDFQQQVDLLNSTVQTSINELRELYDSLNSTKTSNREAITNELNTLRNLMYTFIAAAMILIATTVYLTIRKPRTKSQTYESMAATRPR